MRQIVFDTETTGLSPEAGHRVIEIGCVELMHRKRTERTFHYYFNPERLIDKVAYAVHGLSSEFLADKPKFVEVAHVWLEWIQGAELIAHNASFDIGFLESELRRAGITHQRLTQSFKVIDTLILARKKHPGQKNTLDALCKRYGIDHSRRRLHGALLDAELLAEVYLAMTRKQKSFFSHQSVSVPNKLATTKSCLMADIGDIPVWRASDAARKTHQAMLQRIRKKSQDFCTDEMDRKVKTSEKVT